MIPGGKDTIPRAPGPASPGGVTVRPGGRGRGAREGSAPRPGRSRACARAQPPGRLSGASSPRPGAPCRREYLTALETPALAGSSYRLQALLGVAVIVGVGWLWSTDRRSVSWRIVLWGLGLQLAFAMVVLRTPVGVAFFQHVNTVVRAVLGYAAEGGRFVVGNLVSDNVPVGRGEPGNGAFVAVPGTVTQTGRSSRSRCCPTSFSCPA